MSQPKPQPKPPRPPRDYPGVQARHRAEQTDRHRVDELREAANDPDQTPQARRWFGILAERRAAALPMKPG